MSMNKEKLKELAATLNGIAEGKAWEREETIELGDFGDPFVKDPMHYVRQGVAIRLKPWSLPPPPDGYEWQNTDLPDDVGQWNEDDWKHGWRPLVKGEVLEHGDQFLGSNGWEFAMALIGTTATWCRTKRPLPPPQQHNPYAELKAAHAAGKAIQIKISSGWFDWPADRVPTFGAPPQSYRIKPDPYAELKAAKAAGKTIQALSADGKWRDWVGGDDFAPREPSNLRIKPETRRVNANPVRIPLCADDIKSGDEFLAPEGYRLQWPCVAKEGIQFNNNDRIFKQLMELGYKIRSIGETEWRECSKEEEVEA